MPSGAVQPAKGDTRKDAGATGRSCSAEEQTVNRERPGSQGGSLKPAKELGTPAKVPRETRDVECARGCAISGDHGWALHEPLQERRPATDGNGESASLSLRRVALFGMTRPDATPKPAEAAAGTATVAELRA